MTHIDGVQSTLALHIPTFHHLRLLPKLLRSTEGRRKKRQKGREKERDLN